MGEENKSAITKGCIKATRGPWLVRRTDKDGRVATKLRFPSERERLRNKQREKRRRDIRRRIFEGLRAHGNYSLPKHADSNDFLVALCEDAGWHVEEDGTIFRRKVHSEARTSSSCATSSENIGHGNCVEYGHIMKANGVILSKIGSPPSVNDEHDREINLTLSL